MKPLHMPIYEAIIEHVEKKPTGFHVPGHRYGKALQPDYLSEHLYHQLASQLQPIMQLDVTELSSTDDLHHPEASILEAQRLAARCFGSDESYFLVGGSTSGNIALILTLCGPGDLIIVQRNVHKSIINGLKLAGASAVFVAPGLDELTGTATVPPIESIEEALRRYPEAKAVFLSNPNYYGISKTLENYVDVIHRFNKPVLVDEAHGAHYGLHPAFPQSAISAGADAVVQSTHKTLLALTMGAMLHIQGERIPTERLRETLAMIQSSSPSFPILISLDISRAIIDAAGEELFEQGLAAARGLCQWLNQQALIIRAVEWNVQPPQQGPGQQCPEPQPVPQQRPDERRQQYDPLRIMLYDCSSRLTGFDLQRELEQYGCWSEMADPSYVVLVIGIGTTDEDIMRLQQALEFIHSKYSVEPAMIEEKQKGNRDWEPDVKETVPNVKEIDSYEEIVSEPASFARDRFQGMINQRIGLDQSEGRLAAEMIIPYPPGIPIVYPGESITTSTIRQIKRLVAVGAKFQGAADQSLSTISVYIEQE